MGRGKQTERLKNHLYKYGSINPLESWRLLGIYRLAARICDLRKQGYNIAKEMVKVRNQYGEQTRVAKYRLEVVA